MKRLIRKQVAKLPVQVILSFVFLSFVTEAKSLDKGFILGNWAIAGQFEGLLVSEGLERYEIKFNENNTFEFRVVSVGDEDGYKNDRHAVGGFIVNEDSTIETLTSDNYNNYGGSHKWTMLIRKLDDNAIELHPFGGEGANPFLLERQTRQEQQFKVDGKIRDCETCPEMSYVEGGCFQSPNSSYRWEFQNRHLVCSKSILVSTRKISVKEFMAFLKGTNYDIVPTLNEANDDCSTKDSQRAALVGAEVWEVWRELNGADEDPAVCVSMKDVQAYSDWLSNKAGQRFRLPTNTEMELLISYSRGYKTCEPTVLRLPAFTEWGKSDPKSFETIVLDNSNCEANTSEKKDIGKPRMVQLESEIMEFTCTSSRLHEKGMNDFCDEWDGSYSYVFDTDSSGERNAESNEFPRINYRTGLPNLGFRMVREYTSRLENAH